MLDLCTNTVSKGESGCIKCIDEPLFDMAKREEIAVLPYDHTESINSFEFFKHLRENNICMKIFFPDDLGSTVPDKEQAEFPAVIRPSVAIVATTYSGLVDPVVA